MKKEIILILLVLISSISLAQEPGKLWVNNVEIPYALSETVQCEDRTLNEQCSSDKPKYCSNGVLVDNCVLCGCQIGKCGFDGICKETEPEVEAKSISYVYANGQRIAKVEDNEVFYFHNDHLGSPRVITDSNGEIIEKIDYLPFGESFEVSEMQSISEHAQKSKIFDRNEKISYNSKELDKDTKLNYYGARYYSASVGRFITADTVKGNLADPQSLNLYVYVKNNPMKYIDEKGEAAKPNAKLYYIEPTKAYFKKDGEWMAYEVEYVLKVGGEKYFGGEEVSGKKFLFFKGDIKDRDDEEIIVLKDDKSIFTVEKKKLEEKKLEEKFKSRVTVISKEKIVGIGEELKEKKLVPAVHEIGGYMSSEGDKKYKGLGQEIADVAKMRK